MSKFGLSTLFGAVVLLGLPGVSSAQRGGHGGGHGGYGHYGYGHGHYGYGYGVGLYVALPFYPYGSPYYGSSYYYEPVVNVLQPPIAPPAYFAPETVPPPSPTEKPNPTIAMLELRVPENAEVWFDGDRTSQTGTLRHFESPTLESGRTYTYQIRARWTDAEGKPVDRTKQVKVQTGSRVGVDFNVP